MTMGLMTHLCFGMAKLHLDGSLNNDRGSWGAMIRDEHGDLGRVAHGFSPFKSMDEIQLDTVEHGTKLALKYFYQDLVINVDSTNVWHCLKLDDPPWNVRHKLKNIKYAIGWMNSCVIEHSYRETNSLADKLAGMAMNERFLELDILYLSNE